MDWDKQTLDEWDSLGYYYEYHEYLKQWRLHGSKSGFRKFCNTLDSYTINPSNYAISEHIHIGPYNYLKIMTWSEPIISRQYIAGSIDDIKNLSKMILSSLEKAEIGSLFAISKMYSPNSAASLLFVVMNDSFKPSSIEFQAIAQSN